MTGFPFWSIFKAILVDNRYASTSQLFIQDLNSRMINCILLSRAIFPDGSNSFVDTIEFNYDDEKRIKNTPIVFQNGNSDFGGGVVTIDDILAYFNTLGDYGTTHWLRKYTTLLAIDLRYLKPDSTGAFKDILLNDRKVVRREFLPASFQKENGQVVDVTNIYVNMNRQQDLKIFTVLGDQTDPSGQEYTDLY